MAAWPLELRALFDPQADWELAQTIAQEKQVRRTGPADEVADTVVREAVKSLEDKGRLRFED